jgi:hypothetical protein
LKIIHEPYECDDNTGSMEFLIEKGTNSDEICLNECIEMEQESDIFA